MRIVVDAEKCICSGMCTTVAPSLFELGAGDDVVVLEADELSTEQLRSAEDAIACCPVEAISLVHAARAVG